MIFALAAAALVCALWMAGALYQTAGTILDSRRYPPPGQLIDVGGHRLHAHISGEGSPAILFESGIAASSVSWDPVRRELAAFARVCTYDRAGLGWSDAAQAPRTLDNILQDLRALLPRIGIDGPFVLVGHSFGGLAALEFACRHPEDLLGLVLIDPLPASEWCPAAPGEAEKLRRGVTLARRGAFLASLGVVRFSLDLLRAGSRRIPKFAARLSSSGSGSKLTERLIGEVRKLPPELWPVIQSHWCQPKSFRSMASHLESLPASASACRSDCDLGSLPVIVLSAGDSTPARKEQHARMANLSIRGELWIAKQSGHWIQLDEPELAAAAVRKIVETYLPK